MGARTAAVRRGVPALFRSPSACRTWWRRCQRAGCRRSSATCWHPRSPWCRPSPGGWRGSGRPRNPGDWWSGGGLLPRLAAARLQMVPLVLSLIQEAGDRAQALDSRGFNGAAARTSYREVPDTAAQRAFRGRRPAAGRRRGGAADLRHGLTCSGPDVARQWPGGMRGMRPAPCCTPGYGHSATTVRTRLSCGIWRLTRRRARSPPCSAAPAAASPPSAGCWPAGCPAGTPAGSGAASSWAPRPALRRGQRSHRFSRRARTTRASILPCGPNTWATFRRMRPPCCPPSGPPSPRSWRSASKTAAWTGA